VHHAVCVSTALARDRQVHQRVHKFDHLFGHLIVPSRSLPTGARGYLSTECRPEGR
jgi:hypothetical protein